MTRIGLLVVGISLALSPTVRSQEAPAAARPKPKSATATIDQYFDSDGVKIHYIERGEGEPVILIHGFTGNIDFNWRMPGIFDALASDYRVIALDNRGHGLSDKPHDAEQYGEKMCEDVVRLMDHLKIDRAHVIGYSMGGFITGKLLAMHPERVSSAVLGGAGWSAATDERKAFFEELATALEEGNGITPLIKRLSPPGNEPPSDEQIAQINGMIMLGNDPKALAAVARGLGGLTVSEEHVKAVRTPTLAVIGELDPLKADVDSLSSVRPDMKVVVLPGKDHMTAISDPKFIEALKGFLAAQTDKDFAAEAKPAAAK